VGDTEVPRAISAYLKALTDPEALLDGERITEIEQRLNDRDLDPATKLDLMLQLRTLRNVDLEPLQAEFIKAVPDYVAAYGLKFNEVREDFLAVGVPPEVLDEVVDRSSRQRGPGERPGTVSVGEVIDHVLERGGTFTNPQLIELTGASRGTVNKAIKYLIEEGKVVADRSRPINYDVT